MTARSFQFRLHSSLGRAGEAPTVLVERLSDAGDWETQDPSVSMPPFRLHLISMLLCMHHHLMAEARERQIPLREVTARWTVAVSGGWDLQRLSASFRLRLDPTAATEARARADAAALAAMDQRMRDSPVPRNRPASVPLHLELALDP